MKILLTTYFGLQKGGGIATATRMIAQELINRGHKIVIAATEDFKIKNVTFYKLPETRNIPNLKIRDTFLKRKIEKIIELEKIDLVHINDLRFMGRAAILAARKKNCPTLVDYRDYWFCCLKGDLLYKNINPCKGMRSLNKCVDCLGAKNNHIKYSWQKHKFNYFHKKIEVLRQSQINLPVSSCVENKMMEFNVDNRNQIIYDTITETNISPIEKEKQKKVLKKKYNLEKKIVIMFAGRLIYHRGIKTILNVARIIQDKDSKINFILIGDGESKKESEDYIEKNKLKNIYLAGQIKPELMTYFYDSCDIFLFPSLLDEPFSRAVLEAIFAEKPVIASNLGGLKEVVFDGENGFLIDPGNYREIARKILLLSNDRELREKMALANRILKKKWSSQAYFDNLEKIYTNIILETKNEK